MDGSGKKVDVGGTGIWHSPTVEEVGLGVYMNKETGRRRSSQQTERRGREMSGAERGKSQDSQELQGRHEEQRRLPRLSLSIVLCAFFC